MSIHIVSSQVSFALIVTAVTSTPKGNRYLRLATFLCCLSVFQDGGIARIDVYIVKAHIFPLHSNAVMAPHHI
jgi:hypothetical protein